MISFTSSTKVLERDQKQFKKWAATFETGTGSYSYQTICNEADSIEELLAELHSKAGNASRVCDCIRHIDDLWFSVRLNKNGKYSVTLRQD